MRKQICSLEILLMVLSNLVVVCHCHLLLRVAKYRLFTTSAYYILCLFWLLLPHTRKCVSCLSLCPQSNLSSAVIFSHLPFCLSLSLFEFIRLHFLCKLVKYWTILYVLQWPFNIPRMVCAVSPPPFSYCLPLSTSYIFCILLSYKIKVSFLIFSLLELFCGKVFVSLQMKFLPQLYILMSLLDFVCWTARLFIFSKIRFTSYFLKIKILKLVSPNCHFLFELYLISFLLFFSFCVCFFFISSLITPLLCR